MGTNQISEAGYNAFWKKDDDLRLYDYLKLIDESGSSFMVSGVLKHVYMALKRHIHTAKDNLSKGNRIII
jgi:uncharacterized protein YihD (DUF1040 family)